MYDGRAPVGLIDISTDEFALDPIPGYNALRAVSPISWQRAARAFLFTQHAHALRALRHSAVGEPNFADPWHKIGRKLGISFDAAYRLFEYLPFTYEGERHKVLRATLAKAVAPFNGSHDVFRRCVTERLALAKENGGFDVVEQFAQTLLFDVFCELMEISQSERQGIKPLATLSWALESTLPVRRRLEMTDIIARSMEELIDIANNRLRKPGTSLLHAIHRNLPDGEEDRVGATAHLAAVMLVMGNDALAGCISFPVRDLLGREESGDSAQKHWGMLSDDAARYAAPVDMLNRLVYSDISIGGCPFRDGDRLVISPLAANHDPLVFGDDAGRIRRRPELGVGLTFGAGSHVCVGARMSRNILKSAYDGMAMLPNMRLAASPRQSRAKIIRTLDSLKVELH